MNSATITKTLNNLATQPKNYSLGFRRITVLPKRVRTAINLACILNGETNNNSMIAFLNGLNETEYINWLKDK